MAWRQIKEEKNKIEIPTRLNIVSRSPCSFRQQDVDLLPEDLIISSAKSGDFFTGSCSLPCVLLF
jgi:hypothetical protein